MKKLIVIRNQTSIDLVGREYQPVMDCVVHSLEDRIKENLAEIRLLGSVPRGNAIPGFSDIDFLAVTHTKISEDLQLLLRQRFEEFSKHFPIVSKIDIQVMTRDEINSHFEYKLIVMTDSVCVFGEDHYTVAEYSILNTELADLWNPDMDQIISSYKKALGSSNMPKSEAERYSRLTGKDMMKCFQRRILLDYGEVEKSMQKVYGNLKYYYPDFIDLFDQLWYLYRYPSDDKAKIISVLDECERKKGKFSLDSL